MTMLPVLPQVEGAVVEEEDSQGSVEKHHKKGDEPSMKKIVDTLYDKVSRVPQVNVRGALSHDSHAFPPTSDNSVCRSSMMVPYPRISR